MLNLASVIDDAIRAVSKYGNEVSVASLPATVYLMQMDVINHYRLALDHYLTLALDAEFLQNSSLGTPYQKWAHVNNENFRLLSFTINNLLRYTSRLFHTSEFRVLADGGRLREIARTSSTYTGAICDIQSGEEIGVVVYPDQRLTIRPLHRKDGPDQVVGEWSPGQPTRYFRVVRNSDGYERKEPIDEAELGAIRERVEFIDIADRTILETVRDRGHSEIAELRERVQAFRQVCDGFYASRSVTEPFENMNASYWT